MPTQLRAPLQTADTQTGAVGLASEVNLRQIQSSLWAYHTGGMQTKWTKICGQLVKDYTEHPQSRFEILEDILWDIHYCSQSYRFFYFLIYIMLNNAHYFDQNTKQEL